MNAASTVDLGLKHRDLMFAAGIVFILTVLFLPIPTWMLDIGLAFSLAVSVLILMVALWIHKPLDFSSFPTILLVVTMLRLALNVASTRLILTHGHQGPDAAGHVIQGFARFVMDGNFVIGLIVFGILVTVNFVVITKGATRIAEVGARFTLDAIPGKQMAIDADLSAGLIDDQQARLRRRELEEESAFFGSMDGASKFVRGDAIAGLIITFINILGGMVIGMAQQGMPLGEAATVFTVLSVGDGLISQIPALIISLAAGMLVTKGGNHGSTEKAVLSQLGSYPKALLIASALMAMLALAPGLPMAPFMMLSGAFGLIAWYLPRHAARLDLERQQEELERARPAAPEEAIEDLLKIDDIQVDVGNQLVPMILQEHAGLTAKVRLLRKRFAKEYGFLLPKVRVKDNAYLPPRGYTISVQGVQLGAGEIRPRMMLAIDPTGGQLHVAGEETREPTFGLPARWISGSRAEEAEAKGFTVVDAESVVITHLTEVIKDNLAALLTYGAVQRLLDGLDGDYRKLVSELVPGQISMASLQNVLQNLVGEQISIRNLPLILEGVAEAVAWSRNVTTVTEHVRAKLAQQISQGLAGPDGFVPVITMSAKWEQAFAQHLVGEADAREFVMPPSQVQEFILAVRSRIQEHIGNGQAFAILVTAEIRPFVRSLLERVSPATPVISHNELHRKVPVKTVDQI